MSTWNKWFVRNIHKKLNFSLKIKNNLSQKYEKNTNHLKVLIEFHLITEIMVACYNGTKICQKHSNKKQIFSSFSINNKISQSIYPNISQPRWASISSQRKIKSFRQEKKNINQLKQLIEIHFVAEMKTKVGRGHNEVNIRQKLSNMYILQYGYLLPRGDNWKNYRWDINFVGSFVRNIQVQYRILLSRIFDKISFHWVGCINKNSQKHINNNHNFPLFFVDQLIQFLATHKKNFLFQQHQESSTPTASFENTLVSFTIQKRTKRIHTHYNW